MRKSPLSVALGAGAAALLAACSTTGRPVLSDVQLLEKSRADAARTAEIFRTAIGRQIERVQREVVQATPDNPACIDILAISGGGDDGAFGAGFLVGWGSIADPEWRRPDFDAVTGVSTGAMLAPFAYIGTDEACRFVEDFYRNPRSDWVVDRGWLFFLPFNPSFMTIPGLERDLRAAVGLEFVEQMAERSRQGKLLAISATDLDLGRQSFWEVGIEAQAAAQARDPRRVQDFMLASAAIPAVFPPIEIDGALYADGGVTANVFLRLDPYSPDAFLPRWRAAHPDLPIPRIRYWIIINNQLSQPPKTVQARWPSIASPSLSTSIRFATLAEVRWLAAEADFVNATFGTNIEVRVVAIPDDFRPPVQGEFKKPTMEALSDLGRKMGADPNSWQLWASPAYPGRTFRPHAPITPGAQP